MNPPKPTKLKVLQGNPGQRKLPANEPRPDPVPPGALRAPESLSEEARVEWDRVAPQLARLGLLTDIDLTALMAYCESWATYLAAQREVIVLGQLVQGQKGNMVRNPAAQIARDALAQAIVLMREFGMTPSARGRMSVNAPADQPSGIEGILSS